MVELHLQVDHPYDLERRQENRDLEQDERRNDPDEQPEQLPCQVDEEQQRDDRQDHDVQDPGAPQPQLAADLPDDPPDAFLLGAAVLGLLAEQPCLVDSHEFRLRCAQRGR
jgi:hypothetical protein